MILDTIPGLRYWVVYNARKDRLHFFLQVTDARAAPRVNALLASYKKWFPALDHVTIFRENLSKRQIVVPKEIYQELGFRDLSVNDLEAYERYHDSRYVFMSGKIETDYHGLQLVNSTTPSLTPSETVAQIASKNLLTYDQAMTWLRIQGHFESSVALSPGDQTFELIFSPMSPDIDSVLSTMLGLGGLLKMDLRETRPNISKLGDRLKRHPDLQEVLIQVPWDTSDGDIRAIEDSIRNPHPKREALKVDIERREPTAADIARRDFVESGLQISVSDARQLQSLLSTVSDLENVLPEVHQRFSDEGQVKLFRALVVQIRQDVMYDLPEAQMPLTRAVWLKFVRPFISPWAYTNGREAVFTAAFEAAATWLVPLGAVAGIVVKVLHPNPDVLPFVLTPILALLTLGIRNAVFLPGHGYVPEWAKRLSVPVTETPVTPGTRRLSWALSGLYAAAVGAWVMGTYAYLPVVAVALALIGVVTHAVSDKKAFDERRWETHPSAGEMRARAAA